MSLRVALASCAPFPPVVDDEGPLREALRDAGCDVIEPAWDAAIAWGGLDAVLLRTTWDYHVRAEAFLAWCERVSQSTRLFAPPEVIRWNIDKRYLARLAEARLPIAETVWGDGERALEEVRRRGWSRGFLKPVIGANAWATLRFDVDEAGLELARAHLAAERGTDFMLQPYLESVESEGELSVVVIDGEVTHGVRKVPVAGDYRVQEDWGAVDEPWAPDAEALELARRACEVASALTGERLLYARVDLLRGPQGLVVNELELIEPALFQRHAPECGRRLARALIARLG
jgi:glutathione synthase/RimK-type ligase-like ATP-grasp enzyme